MKRNHAGKRIVGTLLLIFSIFIAVATIPVAYLYYHPEVQAAIDEWLINLLQADPATTTSTNIEYESVVQLIIFSICCFLLSVVLLALSSKSAIIKTHDVFGQRRCSALRFKFWLLFLLVGFALLMVCAPLRQYFLPYSDYGIIVGGVLTMLGTLFLLPIPANFAVKRKISGDTVKLYLPRKMLNGKFSDSRIINELNWYMLCGYEQVEDFYDFEDKKHGRVIITLKNVNYEPSEVKRKEKELIKRCKKIYKSGQTIEGFVQAEKVYTEGKEYTVKTDVASSVNDYDTVTTYGDGHQETTHHYKTVHHTEIDTYRDKFAIYSFGMMDNGVFKYFKDQKDEYLDIMVYIGSVHLGHKETRRK